MLGSEASTRNKNASKIMASKLPLVTSILFPNASTCHSKKESGTVDLNTTISGTRFNIAFHPMKISFDTFAKDTSMYENINQTNIADLDDDSGKFNINGANAAAVAVQ